jgi:hypothetical protein
LEDIKRNYEETNIRHTKDRILWSYNDSPIGVTRMGNRTHKDSLMKKTFKDFAEACWDTHKQVGFKMKGGKRVPDCVPKNEEEEIEETSDKAMMFKLMTKAMKTMPNSQAQKEIIKQVNVYRKKLGLFALKEEGNKKELEEVSAAMRALRRRNAKSARAKNTIAKYGQAAKMGIPASKVNQRRNTPTRTK